MRVFHWFSKIFCACLIFSCGNTTNAQTVNPLARQWKKLVYHSQWRERADAVVNGLLHGEVPKASDIYLLDGLQPQPKRLIQGGEGPA